MLTIEQIANSVHSSWECGQFDSLYNQIEGMQNALIYWFDDINQDTYDELQDMLRMLKWVAWERKHA